MIHYAVAVFTGNRRNSLINKRMSDPLYLVKKHIDALKNLNVEHITRATFVVAPSDDSKRDFEVINYIKNLNIGKDLKLDAYLRTENTMFSYGSWNDLMQNNVQMDEHFFLIEDDYFPCIDHFYLPFLKKMEKENYAYVCQLWTNKFFRFYCAAISNGLINITAVREHYKKFNTCLQLEKINKNKDHYSEATMAQMKFLNGYIDMGFLISDVADEYAQPFLQPENRVFMYGKEDGKVLIECENFNPQKTFPGRFKAYKIKKFKK